MARAAGSETLRLAASYPAPSGLHKRLTTAAQTILGSYEP